MANPELYKHYHDSVDLDKIIDDNKVKPETAMVIFAVEFKYLREQVDHLIQSINEDNQRYTGKLEFADLKARVDRIETGILRALIIVTLGVMSIAGAAIVWFIQQIGGKHV